MLTDEQRELVRILGQPHRVNNIMALYRSCEQASKLIQEQSDALDELAKPKPAHKKTRTAPAAD